MPLMKCPDCEMTFSGRVDNCPRCGCPASAATMAASSLGSTRLAPGESPDDPRNRGGARTSGNGGAPEPATAGAGSSGGRSASERELGATIAAADWTPGMAIANRYELIGRLGAGAFGEVWKARDIQNSDEDRTLHAALKLLPAEICDDAKLLEQVRRNYQKVCQLGHHRIAANRDLVEDGDTKVLVMEFVEGRTLAAYRDEYAGKHGEFPLSEALRIAAQAAEGLDYAHGEGIVHRDIKPENVMITARGDVKILDFGVAAEISATMTRMSLEMPGRGEKPGTPLYMAPEQMRGKQPRKEMDQYALAVMVYWMAGGHEPFVADNLTMLRECVLNEKPEPLEGLTESQNAALLKALAKDPKGRYGSCAEFVETLAGKRKMAPAVPKTPVKAPTGAAAPARVICPSCRKTLSVPGGTAGKKARCPNCRTVFAVPASRPSAMPNAMSNAMPSGAPVKRRRIGPAVAAAILALGLGGFFAMKEERKREEAARQQEMAAQAALRQAVYARHMREGDAYLADRQYASAEQAYGLAMEVEGFGDDPRAGEALRRTRDERRTADLLAAYSRHMKEGNGHLAEKRYAEAETAYSSALEVEGYGEDAKAAAALTRARDERLAAEQAALRQAEYAEHMKAGDEDLAEKRYAEAEQAYLLAMEVEGYGKDAKALAALKRTRDGRLASERKAYADAMDEGRRQYGQKEYRKAIAAFRQAMEVPGYKDDEAAARELGESRYAGAMAEGRRKIGEKDYARAIAVFRQALAVPGYEDDEEAVRELGTAEYGAAIAEGNRALVNRRFDGAAAAFQKAMDISGYADDPEAKRLLDETRTAGRRYAEYTGFMDKGYAKMRDRDYEGAMADFTRAKAVAGYANDGSAEGGLGRAKDLIRYRKEFSDALGDARQRSSRGDWAGAMAAADRALGISGYANDPDARKLRADAQKQLDDRRRIAAQPQPQPQPQPEVRYIEYQPPQRPQPQVDTSKIMNAIVGLALKKLMK